MNSLKFTNRITDIWDYPKINIYDNNEINDKYLDSLKQEDEEREIRLYIHTPFCNSFCYFCQFYKEQYLKDEKELERYYKAVLKEINFYANMKFFNKCKINSIYFGGGDPAKVDSKYIGQIINEVRKGFNVAEDVEITLEGNVKNLLNEDKLITLKDMGINRVSFGIQTFNENIRKELLLKPTIEEINELVSLLRKVGIDNYTVDLMYDLPDQTFEDIDNDLENAIKLEPQYIDCYSLNLYPNTSFYSAIYEKNRFSIQPSKDREGKMIKQINEYMRSHNMNQVNAVTFSKRETIPNKAIYHYIKGGEMLGIGPSARSFIKDKNFRNICSVEKYVELMENDKLVIEAGNTLTDKDLDIRKMVLFPTLLKIHKDKIINKWGMEDKIKTLVASRYLEWDGDYLKVTDEGKCWIGNIQKYFYDDDHKKLEFKSFLTSIKEGKSAYNQDDMWINKR